MWKFALLKCPPRGNMKNMKLDLFILKYFVFVILYVNVCFDHYGLPSFEFAILLINLVFIWCCCISDIVKFLEYNKYNDNRNLHHQTVTDQYSAPISLSYHRGHANIYMMSCLGNYSCGLRP